MALAALIGGLACSGAPPPPDPRYRPTESVLEVAATLRLHIDDDTYRRPPARDFTGKNVYRASFARLENLEASYASKLRSGYLQDVIWFAMARAAERMTEYDLASKLYAKVQNLESELAMPAAQGQMITAALESAARIRPEPNASPKEALDRFAERIARLDQLLPLPEVQGSHFEYVVREERERADRARAHYFAARRRIDPRLDTTALQAHQDLVQNHPESKNRNRNLLELAGFYEELARDYTDACPPVSLCFDPATFDEYVFGASRIYEAVAQQDGAVEKIEAARRLEALLAFILQVYDDKLPSPGA